MKFTYWLLLFSVIAATSCSNTGEIKTSSAELKALLNQAKSFQRDNLDSCLLFTKKAYELALEEENEWGLGRSKAIAGRALDKKGQKLEAIKAYLQALEHLNLADSIDSFTKYTVAFNIGVIQHDFGYFETSTQYYDSARAFLSNHIRSHPEIARKYADHDLFFEMNFFESLNAYKRGDLTTAKDLLIALLENKSTPRKVQQNALNRLGILLGELGDYDGAIHSFQSILEDPKTDSLGMARALHNIGLQYFRIEKFDSAIIYYKKAIEVEEHLEDKVVRFYSYLDLGQTYLNLGQYLLAHKTLSKADELDVEIENRPQRFVLKQYQGMSLIKSDSDKSLEYLSSYNSYVKIYAEQRLKLDLENKRSELKAAMALYRQNKGFMDEMDDQRNSYRSNTIWILIVTGGFIIALAIWLLKSWRDHRNFKDKLFNDAVAIAKRPRKLKTS